MLADCASCGLVDRVPGAKGCPECGRPLEEDLYEPLEGLDTISWLLDSEDETRAAEAEIERLRGR